MKEWIRISKKRKGYIKNGVYFSNRKLLEHFFYKWRGFGCSVVILAELQKRNIDKIILILDNNRKISASVLDFYKYGKKFTDGRNDNQLILPLHYFKEAGLIEDTQSKLFK